jgi:hypothetical protein
MHEGGGRRIYSKEALEALATNPVVKHVVNKDRLYSVPALLAGLYMALAAAWYWHVNWEVYSAYHVGYGSYPMFDWQTLLMGLF